MSGKEGHQTWETVFTNAKAGMAGVDRDHVKRVVYEASLGSAHFANEQRKQAAVDAKIDTLKRQAAQLNSAQLDAHSAACDTYLASLESTRDLTRTWLHMDMDAFFASVEERDAPHLRSVPMAVGGMGMICTANYEARKCGVRSAMPGFIGLWRLFSCCSLHTNCQQVASCAHRWCLCHQPFQSTPQPLRLCGMLWPSLTPVWR